jgi:MFS superfamily sulfate permease-like transporter
MTPHIIDPTLRDGEQAGAPALVRHRPGRLRFNRNEFAGALGDIGTSLPLLVGVTLAAKLNVASVLTVFGAMQIFTALRYRLPMPVQPLKAMAALVIAQGISGSVLHGAGLAIGICMLIFTVTGGVDTLSRFVPLAVVRGLQLGLGLTLASLALKKYVASDGPAGYALAAVVFLIVLALFGNRRVPAALVAVGIGMIYAVLFKSGSLPRDWSVHLNLPQFSLPASQDILTGFVLLALPQIPLSLGNSVLATGQIARDLFPERRITNRMIGYTYSLMNLVTPMFGGVPVCHGSGGMAGHYAFGARTGGSVLLYGSVLLLAGVCFGPVFNSMVGAFPLPVLGVMLLFESISLLLLTRDVLNQQRGFIIAVITGLAACYLPYGFAIGLVLGTTLEKASARWSISFLSPKPAQSA